jgi:hypothetical protein
MEKYNWKVLTVVFLLLVVIIVILIISGFKAVAPSKPVQEQSVTNTYKDSNFSLSYPSDVKVSPREISEGKLLSFQLPFQSYYYMSLSTTPKNITNIQKITQLFQDFNYQGSDITVGGIQGKKFVGNYTLGNETYQETVAVVENQDQLYQLQLKYLSNVKDQKLEDIFSQVLASVKLING